MGDVENLYTEIKENKYYVHRLEHVSSPQIICSDCKPNQNPWRFVCTCKDDKLVLRFIWQHKRLRDGQS